MKKALTAALLAAAAGLVQADVSVVDFDALDTGADNYYMASDDGVTTWSDNGASFSLNYSAAYGSWDGITYSSVNDVTTEGWSNQYAVYGASQGVDKSGSGAYAVGYYASWDSHTTVSLGGQSYVEGLYVNNTTYTALSMLNGDSYAKQFGGDTGDDEDWFMLTVEGFNGTASQGTVDFYLADYRSSDNSQDYILDDWGWVDLSGLGSNVTSLAFTLSSSDTSYGYMNTPSYFALDELTYEAVPEPSTVLLVAGGFGGLAWLRRRRKYFFRG